MMSKTNPPNRPVVSLTVTPRTERDRQILQKALDDMARQDSTIRVAMESKGLFIIEGRDEAQLQSIRGRVLRECGVEADIDLPKVIYLETIRKQAEAEGEFMRVKVTLRLVPLDEGDGYQFVNEIKDEAVPTTVVGSIDSAIQEAMQAGILAGQKIIDFRAVLRDGCYPREDLNESAFKVAASMAFKKAVRRADPVVLEPIMSVHVKGPEQHLNTRDIIGNLKSRRGDIIGSEHDNGSVLLRAIAPLAEMNGFSSFIHLNTEGRGEVSMRLIRYAEALPGDRSGDDDEPIVAAEPGPEPDSGPDQAGVFAFRPKGPKPKSRSAAANLDSQSE